MTLLHRGSASGFALLFLFAFASGCGSSGSPVALSNIPRNLSYTPSSLSLALGVPMVPAVPRLTGTATVWKVEPKLPSGLGLDPASGTISGTPKQLFASTLYTVVAAGDYGSTKTTISVAVALPAQDALLAVGDSGLLSVSAPGISVGSWLPPTHLDLGAPARAAALATQAGFVLTLLDDDTVLASKISASTLAQSRAARSQVLPGASAILAHDDLAFVVSNVTQQVAVYAIGATDGALVQFALADTGVDPCGIAVARDGKDLLVVCKGTEELLRYRVDKIGQKLLTVERLRLGRGPCAIAVKDVGITDATSGFLLIADSLAKEIEVLTIDPDNGDLRAVRRVPVGKQPSALAVDPTGTRAFVLAGVPPELVSLSIGQDLSVAETGRVALPDGVDGLTLAVDAKELITLASEPGLLRSFAIGTAGVLSAGRSHALRPGTRAVLSRPTAQLAPVTLRGMIAIDRDAGTVVEIQNGSASRSFRLGVEPSILQLDRASSFALVACRGDDTLWRLRIDPANGRILGVDGPAVVGGGLADIAIEPSGRFCYVTCATSNELVTLSLAPQVPTVVKRSTAGVAPKALALDPSGRFLAATITGWQQLDIYYVDPKSGIPLGISYAIVGSDPRGITFDLEGRHVYVATGSGGTVLGYAIDAETGALTALPTRTLASQPSELIALEGAIVTADRDGSDAQSLLAEFESGALLTAERVATLAGVQRLVPDATRTGFWAVATLSRSLQRIGRDLANGVLGVRETIPTGFAPADLVIVSAR